MIYNDLEKEIAKKLCDPETLKLLNRLFCPDRSKVRTELEKNIAALSNEQYGEAMKVLYASELHFSSAMAELVLLGRQKDGKAGAVAPV